MGFRKPTKARAAIARHRPIGSDSRGSINGARSRRLRKGGSNETLQPKRVQTRKSARVSPPDGDAALRHAGQGRGLLEPGDQVLAAIQSGMRVLFRSLAEYPETSEGSRPGRAWHPRH